MGGFQGDFEWFWVKSIFIRTS